MGMLIRKEIEAISQYNNVSLPLGIEYERLSRDLQNKAYEKNRIDKRIIKDVQNKIISPGQSNIVQNQSSINFEEPNTKPPYPCQYIPYSQGVVWE